MAAATVNRNHGEINRRDVLRAAGAQLLAAAGTTAFGGRLGPAEAAIVSNPLPPILPSNLKAVELIEFSTPPRTANGGAKARLNFLYHRGDGSGKLFVNDSRGKLWSLNPTTGAASLFLDLAALRNGALYPDFYQQGLRSFAFHPNFSVVGAPGFAKFYTVSAETAASRPGGVRVFDDDLPVVRHHNVVAEWQVDAATLSTVIPSSRRELLRIAQWREDHCSDQLMFNPNGGADFGNLYLTTGDGGNSSDHSDPYDRAQSLRSALGKILRFVPLRQGDGRAYAVPAGNPFVGQPPSLPEIYAYGLRHPQNLSFDTGGAGKLICTDIGQHKIEEINIVVPGGNYGWPAREGTFATNRFNTGQLSTLPPDDASNGYIYPVAQYDHDEGNTKRRSAIAGGFVYRGAKIPYLRGHYICGDIVTGRIFHVPVGSLMLGQQTALKELTLRSGGVARTLMQLVGGPDRVDLRFGQDDEGELYALTKQDGKVRKLAPT